MYRILCFNTSHVTLYRILFLFSFLQATFQYISCYSLSEEVPVDLGENSGFQYISCYSLSKAPTGDIVNCEQFQYISCYSLS